MSELLLDKPTLEQRALLDAVEQGRTASAGPGTEGSWPRFGFVEWALDAHDPPLDANEVALTLPTVRIGDRSQYSAVWGSTAGSLFRPNDRIGLTLVGRTHVNGAVDPFVRIIGNLASLRLDYPHDPQVDWEPPELHESDVWAQRDKGLYPPYIRRQVTEVLEHEPPTQGEVVRSGDAWRLRLSRRLRGFEGVTTMTDYVAVLESMAVPIDSIKEVPLSPLALPSALDYFDVVWRLKFGNEQGILQIPNAEQMAMLALEAHTGEELLSRLSALREVLSGFRIPGSESQPLERFRGRMTETVSENDLELCNQAIDTLVSAIDLRNGVIHRERRTVPQACRDLGVVWPISDYGQAWLQIQFRCVQALATLRELLRAEPGNSA